jgi:hypothetical protein
VLAVRDQFDVPKELRRDAEPLRSVTSQWRAARSAWDRAEDALVEFRARVSRGSKLMTAEQLKAGEELREQRDETFDRLYKLDELREATWKAALQQARDSVRL